MLLPFRHRYRGCRISTFFSDRDNLNTQTLNRKSWFCDNAPIKHAHGNFINYIAIHIQLAGPPPPPPSCIYVLLPNKREHIYKTFLNDLSQQNAKPNCILLDFQRAVVNAFSSHYPGAHIKGC